MAEYCKADSCMKFQKDSTKYCREHQDENYRSENV